MIHNQVKSLDFYKDPISFNKNSPKEFLQYCLGATLYMPSTKNIAHKIVSKELIGLSSLVMCFEDAISLNELPAGEENVINELLYLHNCIEKNIITYENLPLIFLRVRNVEQFQSFISQLDADLLKVITGFVLPKFYSANACEYYNIIRNLNGEYSTTLYAMPIIEGELVANIETSLEELIKLKEIIVENSDLTLNVRIGGTDFSSFYSLRRGINATIYDLVVVKNIISNILNVFTRHNSEIVISAPVWEYFLATEQNIKVLDENLTMNHVLNSSNVIFNDAVDGLLREILLDKMNGMVGKTVIHPSHVKFVNSFYAVTKEEYLDALQIYECKGGVIKSLSNNKMNEIGPHFNWAKSIINRSEAFGVIYSENDYFKLVEEF